MTAPLKPYKRSLLRQERSLNTRRAILRAASELFAEQDFDATTTEEICRAAGVGRSTFYLYFETRDHLLLALARETGRAVAGDVDSWLEAGSIDDALRTFINGLVRRTESVPKNLAAIVMRRVSAATVTPRAASPDPALFEATFAGIIEHAQARGEIRREVDARLVGEALAGLTLDALQRWAGGTEEPKLRQTLEFRLTTFLAAMRT